MFRFAAYLATAMFGAILLAVTPLPASAGVTGALLAAAMPSYSGSCPASMMFSGTITGSPGTAFQYSFNRFINGIQQVQNVGAATIPASGSVAVSDSMSIVATSTGVNFDQIWVHNIAGGQSDVYSNRAAFSVTCGGGATAPPGGISKFSRAVMTVDPNDAARNPASPFDISASFDPKVCAAHVLSRVLAVCRARAPGRQMFIVWSWVPSGTCLSCPQDVDGYKIYLTDASRSTKSYITQTSAGAGTTVSVVYAARGNFAGKCFSVSAYKGAKESTLGTPTCL